MPAFKPFAGFSPNCWAVRVQTEHWALASRMAIDEVKINKKTNFFIPAASQEMWVERDVIFGLKTQGRLLAVSYQLLEDAKV